MLIRQTSGRREKKSRHIHRETREEIWEKKGRREQKEKRKEMRARGEAQVENMIESLKSPFISDEAERRS